jgi:hypothetical protein
MAKTPETKTSITIDSPVTLKGLVKAIFKDTIHVQIGGKIIPIPANDLLLDK